MGGPLRARSNARSVLIRAVYTSERWRRNFRGISPAMKDMQAHLKTLRTQIAECERLRRTAKSKIKRDIARLVVRYKALARDLERAIAAAQAKEKE